MQTIKRIDAKSCANIYAYFVALAAFFTALLIAVVNVFNVSFFEGYGSIPELLMAMVINFVIGCLVGLISAIAGAIFGYITGLIVAWFYNKAVKLKLIDGIKIDLE